MKTKNWFVALIVSFLLPLSVEAVTIHTDVIDWNDLVTSGYMADKNVLNDMDGLSSGDLADASSSTIYGGWLGYFNKGDEGLFLNSDAIFGSKVSGGKLKALRINWMTEWAAPGDKIYVYGGSSKFNLEGVYSDIVAADPTIIATFTFDGSAYSEIADVLSVGNFEHFIITTDGEDVYFSSIEVSWQEVVKYGITFTPSGGTATLSPSGTTYEAGEDVRVSIVPGVKSGKTNWELKGYKIGDGDYVDLGAANYTQEAYALPTFVMPAGGITIAATLGDPISRKDVYIYFYKDAVEITSDDLTSDDNYTYTFQLKKRVGKAYSNITDYAGEITLEIEDPDRATQVGAVSFNAATGAGTFTVRGLLEGTTRVSINISQDANYKKKQAYLGLTIYPKDVVLLTTFNDKWYVMKNALNGSNRFDAEEVLYVNGTIYYKPASNPGDFTWQSLRDGDDYVFLSGGYYLGTSTAGKFTLSSTKTRFGKDPEDFDRLSKEGGVGMCIYDSQFGSYAAMNYTSNASYSPSVVMVDADDVVVATQILPVRTQTDAYYSTLCFPFPIVKGNFASGIGTVYNVTGVIRSGDKVTGIELEEVSGNVLAAGKPYIYVADGTSLDVYYGEETYFEDYGYATGLVGNLTGAKLYVPDGGNCYGISNNQIRRVLHGAVASIGVYKAYIDVSGLPTAGSSPAPGRRVMYAYNQEDAATSLEDFLNNATLINWNEPVYNMLGQQVGKGTTGVLIQNGQKFFVH